MPEAEASPAVVRDKVNSEILSWWESRKKRSGKVYKAPTRSADLT